jgi:hypothetical protein
MAARTSMLVPSNPQRIVEPEFFRPREIGSETRNTLERDINTLSIAACPLAWYAKREPETSDTVEPRT